MVSRASPFLCRLLLDLPLACVVLLNMLSMLLWHRNVCLSGRLNVASVLVRRGALFVSVVLMSRGWWMAQDVSPYAMMAWVRLVRRVWFVGSWALANGLRVRVIMLRHRLVAILACTVLMRLSVCLSVVVLSFEWCSSLLDYTSSRLLSRTVLEWLNVLVLLC